MNSAHAPISPSSLELTVACQAHVSLSQDLPPEPDSQEAMEGRAADWVRKEYSRGNEVAHGTPIPLPGNFTVDYDMIHAATMWVAEAGLNSIHSVPVAIPSIHPTKCWGEPDNWAWNWNPTTRRLTLRDFKYGFGLVEVMWIDEDGVVLVNWQELAYAVGILDSIGVDVWLHDAEIEFVIVQPRAYHRDGPVRRYVTKLSMLRAQISVAKGAAHRALGEASGPIMARTGTHCKHCPARLVCATYAKELSRTVEFVSKAERLPQDHDAMGVELSILEKYSDMLEGRINALKAAIEAHINGGKSVQGYCMQPGQSRWVWMDGVTFDELDQMAVMIGKSKNFFRKPERDINSKVSSVLTPTQARNAGIDESVINQYAHRPSPAKKLVRQTDQHLMKIFGVKNQ